MQLESDARVTVTPLDNCIMGNKIGAVTAYTDRINQGLMSNWSALDVKLHQLFAENFVTFILARLNLSLN